MISCVFNGRLGNNLFEMANVMSIANKLNEEFIFPKKTWAGHRGYIDVDLSMFNYDFNRGSLETLNEYSESSFNYEEIQLTSNLKLSGFYQSWKYFEDIKDLLINKYFTPSLKVQESIKRFNLEKNTLGISIRRGDYLMLQNNHCVLSVDYYQSAIDKYFMHGIESIYVFSDDIDWCKEVFGSNVHYVTEDVGTQLFLMSKMKNLILSNSTFSWWGAYLNQEKGIIIAPDPWFGPDNLDKDTKDLYYPSWIINKHSTQLSPYTLTQNMFS